MPQLVNRIPCLDRGNRGGLSQLNMLSRLSWFIRFLCLSGGDRSVPDPGILPLVGILRLEPDEPEEGVMSLAASGQRLQQDQISKTRREKKSVSFGCKVTGSCWGNLVHWYQKKEGEPFTWILYFNSGDNSDSSATTHPQRADFSVWRESESDAIELKIQFVKVSHSVTYYCACWVSGFHNNTVRKPKVTVYSESNPESNVKTTLICLARDMFPDLVKISWKMEDENGRAVAVPKAEMEQLEQREEGQTTSMIIINKEKTYRNKYICSVEHEGGPQDVYMLKDKPTEAPPTTVAAPTCPFRNDTQQSQTLHLTDDSFPSTFSLNLASVVYTVMIVKSMVYCCGLSILLHHRRLGRGPSTCRHIY
ncbi:immunoglobulin lambda-1 light chain-like [Salvelinus fontinalis]|uniref:immunoglobulin lambda-1 light chain-like n=1 Tax=Salvelinus fontinalis TaxID=8038 RepID=UPI00248587D5|nr:immunoglobulin lambda-1 light chain-like [Salvelinus fontinalis]